MEEKTGNDLEAIKKYLGLDRDSARKAKWILEELENYGEWGQKVASYFTAILSSTPGESGLVDGVKVDAYKSLFDYGRSKEDRREEGGTREKTI